jgi:hypothetical protein
MDRLSEAELVERTRHEVEKYAGTSFHAKAYSISDDMRQTYVVTGIENEIGRDHSWIIVQARVVGDTVIVDEDTVMDKKLVYALLQAGVPREQIVLAYEGEPLPTHMQG